MPRRIRHPNLGRRLRFSLAATASLLMLTPFHLAQAAKEKVLYSFTGGADGAFPLAGLISDAKGNFYGTTFNGGANGAGEIFKLSRKGKLTVLYSFAGVGERGHPAAGLIMDKAGYIYGTTLHGGESTKGTVFVFANGNFDVLYAFTGGDDGGEPVAGLIADAQGDLYSTTASGGGTGAGLVFKLASKDNGGGETVLHTFTGGSDGGYPQSGLITDKQGNFYGTAKNGGGNNLGVVFKLAADGSETVLHSFDGSDGGYPYAGVIMDQKGSLYGTTYEGGNDNCTDGCGTVFKLTPKGNVKLLHAFKGGKDGSYPLAGLIMDTEGNLYGTTSAGGGASDAGIVFKLTPNGDETVLHTFGGNGDGATPRAGLFMDGMGKLYGTTAFGGASNAGTVFKLTP